MKYHLTKKSSNAKTGAIAVSTTSKDSCPAGCPFKRNGCYADGGPLAMHWAKISDGDRGVGLSEFCRQVSGLPRGRMFRHNQAGDLPGPKDLRAIVRAARGLVAWTYTHKRLTAENVRAWARAVAEGFVVNVSANSVAEVDSATETGLPVVCVLPVDETRKVVRTPGGNRVVVCPAVMGDTTCESCGNGVPLCARGDRSYAIGFPAHGSSKRKASEVAGGVS